MYVDHRHIIECVPAFVLVKPYAHRAWQEWVQRWALRGRSAQFGEADARWLAAQVVQLTPDMARSWLASLCPCNAAPPEAAKVAEFAALLRAGAWKGDYSPVVFARTGCLVDGKHRCAAVIAAGVSIQVLRTYAAIDGYGRSCV